MPIHETATNEPERLHQQLSLITTVNKLISESPKTAIGQNYEKYPLVSKLSRIAVQLGFSEVDVMDETTPPAAITVKKQTTTRSLFLQGFDGKRIAILQTETLTPAWREATVQQEVILFIEKSGSTQQHDSEMREYNLRESIEPGQLADLMTEMDLARTV